MKGIFILICGITMLFVTLKIGYTTYMHWWGMGITLVLAGGTWFLISLGLELIADEL